MALSGLMYFLVVASHFHDQLPVTPAGPENTRLEKFIIVAKINVRSFYYKY